MSGPEFFQTRMGRTFYEGTMPGLVKQLKRINDNLERADVPVQEKKDRVTLTRETYNALLLQAGRSIPSSDTPPDDEPIPYSPTKGQRFRADRPNISNTPKAQTPGNLGVVACSTPSCPLCGFFKGEPTPLKKDKDSSNLFSCPECENLFASTRVRCDDCGWKGAEFELREGLIDIPDLESRLDAGGEVPIGTCPQCESLAFIARDQSIIVPHLTHLGALEIAFYGGEDGEVPHSVTVECTKCGTIIHELFSDEFEG